MRQPPTTVLADLVILSEAKDLRGGIAKVFGLDDGPTHGQTAIVKGQALGDATRTRNT